MAQVFDFDAIIVGAGAIGLAIAASLGRRGQQVLVLEKGGGIGGGVSSRSSEVIHSGLYYPANSLRARMCVAGRRALYDWLRVHKVAHEKCGKLIVATQPHEIPKLLALEEQARLNGVEGIRRLSAAETREREPEIFALAALLSEETGILDAHGFMLSILGEIAAHDGAVALRTPFLGAAPLNDGGFRITTGGEQPTTATTAGLVIAAGLGAQDAAMNITGYPIADIPRLHFGKGDYFRLTGPQPFRGLVYPLPEPGALGTHYTRDLAGQGRFGPDLEFVTSESYDVNPGKASLFERSIRRYWPGLPEGALEPGYAGIRPKIHGPGEAQPDFRIDGPDRHRLPGLVTLFGIESPGLTCSLAIAEAVADILDKPGKSPHSWSPSWP